MRRLGDRRSHVRFDVVGALWGSLETREVTHLVDISTTGALIRSRAMYALQSLQSVQVSLGKYEITLAARVRHLRGLTGTGGAPQYLIGLEFLSPPPILAEALRQLAVEFGPPD